MNYGMTKPPLGSVIDWSHPLSKGIVGCWLFNEGQGDKVNDISGNKNHGTLTNFSHPATTTSGWNPGRFGKTLKFDGSNDYIYAGSNVILYQPAYYTISCWANKYANSSWNGLVEFDFGYGNKPSGLTGANNEQRVCFRNADVNEVWTPANSILYNKLYHIVGVWSVNYSNAKIYINGISQNISGSGVGPMAFAGNKFGSAYANFNGTLENVLLYNRALSPQEVQQLYISPFCFIK